MKKTRMNMGALIVMFAVILLSGCAAQNMNDPMNSSRDTMPEEKMDAGMGSMHEKEMQNMQDNEMEKTMGKTMN
jgi:outer membrane biogenesis lipoprotein LolB